MGVLKLSVIEEQLKKQRAKLKLQQKNKEKHIGNCSCPCWAFCIKVKSLIMMMTMLLQQEAGTLTNSKSCLRGVANDSYSFFKFNEYETNNI